MANAKPRAKKENRFLRAVKSGRPTTPEGRIQMLVESGLMTQEEADQAKLRHREK